MLRASIHWPLAGIVILAVCLALIPSALRQDQTVVPVSAKRPSAEVHSWLNEHAVPFHTHLPADDDPFGDLRFLTSWLNSVRVVGLGETTHGTHECFAMKHRLLQFLVQEMGFTLFAMEASLTKAQELNTYVQTGEGDPEELLRGLGFWTWDTDEVLSMVKWMRRYNETRGDRAAVQFVGVDIQSPFAAMEAVEAFLVDVAPEEAPALIRNYDGYRALGSDLERYRELPPEQQATCRQGLQAIESWLLERQDRLGSHSGYLETLMNARMVRQNERLYGRECGVSSRDQAMAENALAYLSLAGPSAKMVLWAHNAHVAFEGLSYYPMGAHLRDALGKTYAAVGFTFYDGAFNAIVQNEVGQIRRLGEVQLALPPDGAFEVAFRALEHPRFMLDLRDLTEGSAASDWLAAPNPFRQVGAVYTPERPEWAVTRAGLSELFDVIIHFQNTSASKLHIKSTSSREANVEGKLAPIGMDFEADTSAWELSGTSPEDFTVDAVSDIVRSGAASGRLASIVDVPSGNGNIKQAISAEAFQGQRVRLSAWVRAEDVTSWAGLWLLITNPEGVVAFDNMSDRPIEGTTDWARYEIVLSVPEDASIIMLGLSLDGSGVLWIDDIALERMP